MTRPTASDALLLSDDLQHSDALQHSQSLHERVRRFAQRSMQRLPPPTSEDTFEALALDIAHFQKEQCPGFARLLARWGGQLASLSDIPPVPVDAFRLTRVAAHPRELDHCVFVTSGTTNTTSGLHPIRDLTTYDFLAVLLAEATLFRGLSRSVVVALAPAPGPPLVSSLAHMMELFIEHFDGRALSRDPNGVHFSAREEGRWLLPSTGIDIDGLKRAAFLARSRSEPLVVLGTSFALHAMVEALDGEVVKTPADTRVMITGGFKGRQLGLDPKRLREAVARSLDTATTRILGEYGMTELTSQLYEGWAQPPCPLQASQDEPASPGRPETFRPPPWLKVSAVDPTNYRPVTPGRAGLARFVDLGNVDSALSIVTQDLIIERSEGIELLGRQHDAPARGCSLPFEGLIAGSFRRVELP